VKVVLDTNVLVSGILFTRVATELQREFTRVDLTAALDLVLVNAHAFPRAVLESPVCADPDDDKFLACAVASGAGTIVSGDAHLLRVSGYRGIEVLRPRVFLERYLAR
jgi:predicted nucleic acid-binding protein